MPVREGEKISEQHKKLLWESREIMYDAIGWGYITAVGVQQQPPHRAPIVKLWKKNAINFLLCIAGEKFSLWIARAKKSINHVWIKF